MNNGLKIRNFYKRWKIDRVDEIKFSDFKKRNLNSIFLVFGDYFSERVNEMKYLLLIGEKIPMPKGVGVLTSLMETSLSFTTTKIYTTLYGEEDLNKYLFYIQALFWIDDIQEEMKINLYNRFKEDIENSQININLKKKKSNYIFYPQGAKLLDENLINDVIDWLVDYNDVYNNFASALDKYLKKALDRNIIDDMRLSLELLLKRVLRNKKPLEKQKENIGRYLKAAGISAEIANMYQVLLKYYTDYQNENVKHNNTLNKKEIEFMIYLTGLFMRLILTCEENEG